MRVSTSTSILLAYPPHSFTYGMEQVVELCRCAGFRNLDINFYDQGCENFPLAQDNWESWIYQVKNQAEKQGVSFCQSHSFCYRTAESTNPDIDRPWYEERIRRSILASAMLGVQWTVVHPADFYADETYSFEKNRDFNREYWAPFIELAVKNDVGFAIENMFQSGSKQRYCSEVDELIELVDSFNEPMVGICWDTGHGNLAAQQQRISLRKIGKRLKAMHVNDNWGHPKQDEHLMPYYGGLDWKDIMEALAEIGYENDFAFELKHATQPLPYPLHEEMLHFLHTLGSYLVSLSQ